MAKGKNKSAPTCPLTAKQALDLYFLEHRAKLIDIAAFLDRLDRSGPPGSDDYRRVEFERVIRLLIDGQPERARRILELLSDSTEYPIPSAAGMKGATGAYRHRLPESV